MADWFVSAFSNSFNKVLLLYLQDLWVPDAQMWSRGRGQPP